MLGEDRGAVVVVARVGGKDAGVRLRRKRGDYVRKRIVRQPGRAVVIGLARPHPVTGSGRVTKSAVGALALVIPRRQESAGGAYREVRLPLSAGSSIGVQLEWRAKGHTTVGGTDIIDVARVTPSAVLGIDQVNKIVDRSRLTPALVSPVTAAIGIHAGEVGLTAAIGAARSGEGRAGIGVGPGDAAVR